MKLNQKTYVMAALVALSACGGGGGDSDNVVPGPTEPTSLEAYVGRWQAPCIARTDAVKKRDSEPPAYLSIGMEFNLAVVNGRLEGTRTNRIYDDETCTTAVLATSTSSVQLTNDGAVTASGKAALKSTLTLGPSLTGLGGQTITLNDVTYLNETGFWTTSTSFKDLIHVDGNKLYLGEDEPRDAAGYPTTLDLAPDEAFTKL